MALRQTQSEFLFTFCTKLVPYAWQQGFELTWGEAKRSDEQAEINAIGLIGRQRVISLVSILFPKLAEALKNNGKNGGIRGSLHELGLAVDTNLFKGGLYLPNSEDHHPLGTYWKTLHPLARWGGDFTKIVNGKTSPAPDGNHYSFEWEGKK